MTTSETRSAARGRDTAAANVRAYGGITPEAWRGRGRYVEMPDCRVFAVELGAGAAGDAAKTPLLILHGFPTSSWDFAECASILARERRVVLFDFLGFGFSDKPHDAGYSLFEQAEVASAVARSFGLGSAHIWGHDMGTSVTTELLSRRERGNLPFEVASVTLMNGSVHIEMASLTLGQKILRTPAGGLFSRIANRNVFVRQMRRIFGKQPAPEALDGMWDLMAREEGTLRMPQLIKYVDERYRFRRRWIGALERNDLPFLVAWGAKDPVAVLPIAERLANETPGAEDLVTWDDLGHYPQVEDPPRVAETIASFLRRVDDGTASGPRSGRGFCGAGARRGRRRAARGESEKGDRER